jgi:hypothetical protein
MLWDRMVRSSLPRTDSFLQLTNSEIPKVWHEKNLIKGTCIMNGDAACLPVRGLSVSTYVQTVILRASLCGDVMTNSASSLSKKGCLHHRTIVNIRMTDCSIQLFSVPCFWHLANKRHVPVCLSNGDCDSLLRGTVGVYCFRSGGSSWPRGTTKWK